MVLAATTVANMLMTTVTQIMVFPGYWIIRRIKFTTASTKPTIKPTRISFHKTFNTSDGSISPRAMPRITMVLLWLPEFPPVSINIGIKLTNSGTAAKAVSYFTRIAPVMVLDSIRIRSHGILFFASWNTLVFKYGFSLGSMAAIFSKSSVASSSMTSITSSTVMIPTRRSSLSTTGIHKRPYLFIISATASWSSVVVTLITWVSIIVSRRAS